MKSIRLDIEYPRREFSADRPDWRAEHVSLRVIDMAVQLAYPGQAQGGRFMPLAEQKMWVKILDRITDEDGKPVCGDVELSDEQFDFLRKVVKETAVPSSFATANVTLGEYLDTVQLQWAESHK